MGLVPLPAVRNFYEWKHTMAVDQTETCTISTSGAIRLSNVRGARLSVLAQRNLR